MTVVGCDIPEEEVEKKSEEETKINWNSHRYVLYVGGLSWTAARDYCKSIGGHLVTITSSEEQEAVYNLVTGGNKTLYWIGGTQIDGNWVWVTGEQWEYTNWAPGETNHDGNERYIQMHRTNIRGDNAGK